MADGQVALIGGKLCVLPGAGPVAGSNGSAPVPIEAGIPADILARIRKAFPLRTHVRTSNPPVAGGNISTALWSPDPLRVGAILSLAGAPGVVYLSERASITTKGFQAQAGALLAYGLECPETLFGYSDTGEFNASLMEILLFAKE